MSTLVTRVSKGSPLTHNEVDANFTNLNSDKVEKTSADITGGTINGTFVGATTPSTGAFTTLSAITSAVVDVNTSTAALRITQLGTGNALLVEDETNPDSTPFVVNADGRVLIGGATSVSGTITALSQVQGTGTSTAYSAQSYSTSNPPTFEFDRSRGAIGAFDIVSNNDVLGRVFFDGADGTAFIRGAEIQAAVDGTPGTNDMPGRLVFSTTADGASSPTERMRITNAGNVGIGVSPAAGQTLRVGKNLTGAANAYSVLSLPTVQSDVTGIALGITSQINTAAASFTTSQVRHFNATQGTIGSGSTVTSQYGYYADSSIIGATNNYGFFGNIAAGTGRWNFYAAGSANNYMAGTLGIGTTSPSASSLLDVQSTTKGVRMPNMTTTQKNAISSPAAGLMVFDTTLSKLCVYTGAAWETITSI